ncbi:hypothetical protein, partial [Acetobacter pasteurianus]|uniref:hypothetical protein n=1 Tax=Acetobacter pasteurianus TaxID=438 RepID=UPI001BDD9BDC
PIKPRDQTPSCIHKEDNITQFFPKQKSFSSSKIFRIIVFQKYSVLKRCLNPRNNCIAITTKQIDVTRCPF